MSENGGIAFLSTSSVWWQELPLKTSTGITNQSQTPFLKIGKSRSLCQVVSQQTRTFSPNIQCTTGGDNLQPWSVWEIRF